MGFIFLGIQSCVYWKTETYDMFNRYIIFQNDFLYVFLLMVSLVYINFKEISLREYRQIPIRSINPRVLVKLHIQIHHLIEMPRYCRSVLKK